MDITGTPENDHLTGTAGDDHIEGLAGNDTIEGNGGNDVAFGGDGDDIIHLGADNGIGFHEEAHGGAGNDTITVNSGFGMLYGDDGDDVLTGNGPLNTLYGGSGNDQYFTQDGATIVEGVNEGIDTVTSGASMVLSENVENLILVGSSAEQGTGNRLDNVITGTFRDNILDGSFGADTLAGLQGNDTYYVDNAGDSVTELADAGTDNVIAHLSYELTADVENLTLIGGGNYAGTGNDLDNTITGNVGNNRLDGGLGGDVLVGGIGNDTYVVDNVNDLVVEYGGEGTDSVEASASYSLGDNLESLTLTGSGNRYGNGNALDNVLNGNSGANTLRGNDGNDVITGGAGADAMYGGMGDDVFYVDNTGDTVHDYTGQGTDRVFSSVTLSLSGTAIENVNLTGAANIDATGNGLGNTLVGNSGDNALRGGGGVDTLIGGLGNDTYFVDGSDTLVEDPGSGIDTVITGMSYQLGAYLDNLTLTGSANLNATGNGLANVLTGNAGDNVLRGLDGNDTMIGGAGNDTYVVENAGDHIVENAGEGMDVVHASVTFSLAGAFVEDLVMKGSGDINATGNSLDNHLTGNAGINHIDGGSGNDVLDGGAGADTLIGGDGDDIFYAARADDRVVESAGGGNDTVYAAAGFNLYGTFVETLILTGSASDYALGNSQANTLIGNAGDNYIDGSYGNDRLTGGAGADAFHFLRAFGADVITDFSAAEGDRILFNDTTHDFVITQVGADAVITLNGQTVTVLNTNATDPDFLSHIQHG